MKLLKIILSIFLLIGLFLTYRYFVWGKGNKGFATSNPTTFGF